MFKLTLLTPDKKVFVDQEIEEVTVPAYRGELNILPGHSPLITTLSTGIMRWRLKGESELKQIVVSWGYCQITPSGVDVLADMVDLPEDVNVEEAKQMINENEKKLLESLEPEQFNEVQRDLARARAHLEIARA
jgi:F-type H+-transporting ATPase subunit epsilon